MTSEQIQKLNLMVAENGRAMPDGSHEAVSLMHVQMLGEIAYQLARHFEREIAADSVDWQERCQCTHKRLYHHAKGCSHGECECEGWIAA